MQRKLSFAISIMLMGAPVLLIVIRYLHDSRHIEKINFSAPKKNLFWTSPDTITIPHTEEGNLIRYGRDLVVNTSRYFGPRGNVMAISNGMNCQNCHLEAATKIWGNNFSAVASLYPKFRARSGTVESITRKINDCFERSMNGDTIPAMGKEMRSMIAYMQWLGSNVKKGEQPLGAGLRKPVLLNRAADTMKGKKVYISTCQACHGINGEGRMATDNIAFLYPPLWGRNSYNTGAGIFRLSKFASYVRDNMPFGVTFRKPLLSDEEAWDVAAFVNSQQRPFRDTRGDWPDVHKKPADNPFGPYADRFSQQQHKYGPFGEMKNAE